MKESMKCTTFGLHAVQCHGLAVEFGNIICTMFNIDLVFIKM